MTQEEKNELYQYLCCCLPYGVKVLNTADDLNEVCVLDSIMTSWKNKDNIFVGLTIPDDSMMTGIEMVKPYLRSMESMTEEEREEMGKAIQKDRISPYGEIMSSGSDNLLKCTIRQSNNLIVWLLKNHFDYLGLIPKGLAIAVTEDNNPYK